jgi:FkbM family methyltransferase
MITQILTLFKRRRAARKLGMRFDRAATFELPESIKKSSNQRLLLKLPHDPGTKTAFVDVVLDDCYGLTSLSSSVETVADIGCHAGLFSIAAKIRWPDATIHAYDPNPAMHTFWSHHAEQVGFVGHLEAVGCEAGTVSLINNNDSVQTRTVSSDSGETSQIAFRQVLERLGGHIDLVKLDCEGAEWDIFKDYESWQKVRFLTMEFHLWAGYTLTQLHDTLRALGFTVTHSQMAGSDFGLLRAQRAQ